MAVRKTNKDEMQQKTNKVESVQEVQQEAREEVPQSAGAWKVGDKITVTGRCYSKNSTGGMFNEVDKAEMYVTQVLDGKKYARPIGVARKKDGTRYGWINEKSIVRD